MNKSVLFQNALTDMLREMQSHPDDSLQDITNESLKQWKCGFRVNHDFSTYLVEDAN